MHATEARNKEFKGQPLRDLIGLSTSQAFLQGTVRTLLGYKSLSLGYNDFLFPMKLSLFVLVTFFLYD